MCFPLGKLKFKKKEKRQIPILQFTFKIFEFLLQSVAVSLLFPLKALYVVMPILTTWRKKWYFYKGRLQNTHKKQLFFCAGLDAVLLKEYILTFF